MTAARVPALIPTSIAVVFAAVLRTPVHISAGGDVQVEADRFTTREVWRCDHAHPSMDSAYRCAQAERRRREDGSTS